MRGKLLYKTVTWNIIAALSGIIGVRLHTGEWSATPLLIGMAVFYYPVAYYIHELVWKRINGGK